jgi:hypothetical protein
MIASNSSPANVVDGPVDIPGRPEEVVPANACRVTGSLAGIQYDGDNVGSDWQFRLSMNTGGWVSGPVTFHWRTWFPVGAMVCDEIRPAACGLSVPISIVVRARERDFVIFDDLGERAEFLFLPCTPESSRRSIVVTVPVREYLGRFWRPALRLNVQTALLHFFFVVTTRCVQTA